MVMEVQIEGFTRRQREIASIIWECKTRAQVDATITLWGTDAIIARDMLSAAVLDQQMEVDPKVVDFLASL
jgi:23S rRNA C2498 (ribose-2'-O)-methylase RlmM